MDKYKNLAKNTMVFAAGTLASKLMVFLLMPFYTRVLSESAYGTVDIVVQTCNLLIPLATLGITHAIIRFGLDRLSDKKSVYTLGLLTSLCGFLVLLCFAPLMGKIEFLSEFVGYIYIYILASSLQMVCAEFIRALGYVRLYAADGVFRTVLMIVLNIVFLGPLKMGPAGYMLANILTDAVSTVLLFFIAKLYKYISIKSASRDLAAQMLKYAVPMIPNTICTWIINISSRYIIAFLISTAANGLYAVANKVPTILIHVSNIFSGAWQISAVTEEKERERFFSQVFGMYCAIAFLSGSVLIATAQISTALLASPDYFEAWKYLPFLVMGTMFSCLAAFLSSVYMVEKKSKYTFYTTLIAAVVNIVLNIALIPFFGANGAAIATFISYFTMFAIRFVHTRKWIKIRMNPAYFWSNFVLIFAQCVLILSELPYYLVYQSVLFLVVAILNFKKVWGALDSTGLIKKLSLKRK
ncbi:MAG: polysaccharide biosynthesis C-terminal domain-containing protein [Clostridia bacterium]|nr:polysaccharide biosynthesis C-terminal domain-containing protein [Clostridia bacterium]